MIKMPEKWNQKDEEQYKRNGHVLLLGLEVVPRGLSKKNKLNEKQKWILLGSIQTYVLTKYEELRTFRDSRFEIESLILSQINSFAIMICGTFSLEHEQKD